MRWFRTFALLLLILFLLLIAAPAYRWYQSRITFVPTDPANSDLVFAAAPAPRWTLIPRVVPESGFIIRDNPIGDYLALREAMARMEPYRIEGTDLYDLRPYLSKEGMTFSPEAVASWDPKSETALLKLPAGDLHDARALVSPDFNEWYSRQITVRASVVAVDWENAANFFSADQNLTLEWLAGLPPESVQVLHSISSNSRSGQRTRVIAGEPPPHADSYVQFEFDPVLGSDNLTLDINFSFQCHLVGTEDSGQPIAFNVVTQMTLYAGHALFLELGTGHIPDRGQLAAYYLVMEADRVGTLGTRSKNADSF